MPPRKPRGKPKENESPPPDSGRRRSNRIQSLKDNDKVKSSKNDVPPVKLKLGSRAKRKKPSDDVEEDGGFVFRRKTDEKEESKAAQQRKEQSDSSKKTKKSEPEKKIDTKRSKNPQGKGKSVKNTENHSSTTTKSSTTSVSSTTTNSQAKRKHTERSAQSKASKKQKKPEKPSKNEAKTSLNLLTSEENGSDSEDSNSLSNPETDKPKLPKFSLGISKTSSKTSSGKGTSNFKVSKAFTTSKTSTASKIKRIKSKSKPLEVTDEALGLEITPEPEDSVPREPSGAVEQERTRNEHPTSLTPDLTTQQISIPLPDSPIKRVNNSNIRTENKNSGNNVRKASSGGFRRSSMALRGRRLSSLGNGFEAVPHKEVDSCDFYKHLNQDLPEPQKMRQLSVWCFKRQFEAFEQKAQEIRATHGRNKKYNADDVTAVNICKIILEDLIKDVQTGKISTNWWTRESNDTEDRKKYVPNARNVQNAELITVFEERVRKLKEEKEEWSKMMQSVNRVGDYKKISENVKSEKSNASFLGKETEELETALSDIHSKLVDERYLEETIDKFHHGVHKISSLLAPGISVHSADTNSSLEKETEPTVLDNFITKSNKQLSQIFSNRVSSEPGTEGADADADSEKSIIKDESHNLLKAIAKLS